MKRVGMYVGFVIVALASMAPGAPASAPRDFAPEAAVVLVTSRAILGAGAGNGFVIGDGTLVVTCDHIVMERSTRGRHRMETLVTVFSPYLGEAADARIVGSDEELDLAVLEVPWKGHPALGLADANAIGSARSARVIGRPAVVKRMDGWDTSGPLVESFEVVTEELPVAFVGVRKGQVRFVSLNGTGQLGFGWSGSPMLLPDSTVAVGCFASIGGTKLGEQMVRKEAKGAALSQIPRLLSDRSCLDSLRPADVRLARPEDAHEACSAALRVSSYLQPGRYESALEPARAFVQRRPNSALGHRMLAYTCDEVGKAEEAQESYQRALMLDPNSFSTRLLYAQSLGSHGQSEPACEILDSLWHSDRARDLVAVALVSILGKQKELDRCTQILDEATKVNPRNGHLWQQVVVCRMEQQGPQAAIGPLTRLVELMPERGPFRGTLARLLEMTGALDEAEKHFRTLLEVEPENPVVYLWLAEFLSKHRPRAGEEALQVAEKALTLPPHQSLPREKMEEAVRNIREQVQSSMKK